MFKGKQQNVISDFFPLFLAFVAQAISLKMALRRDARRDLLRRFMRTSLLNADIEIRVYTSVC